MDRTITLRPAGTSDAELLFRIYASTRLEELAPAGWPAQELEAFLRLQYSAQDRHYRAHYQGASFDIIEVDGEAAGRLYVARWPGEIRVMEIALLPPFRGCGIGTILLQQILAEAAATNCSVTIHVEHDNPARRLYQRLGFSEVETRGIHILMHRSPG